MKKDDRNTLLLVVFILIVCLVSLIAIFTLVWKIIANPVRETVNAVNEFLQGEPEYDYNFDVPEADAESKNKGKSESEDKTENDKDEKRQEEAKVEENKEAEEKTPDPVIVYDYNFPVPEKPANAEIDQALLSYPDAIVTDAQLAGYGTGTDTPQINMQIIIPRINVNSPVWQGLGANDLLQKGFWVHPASSTLGQGEVIMLCHRRYFGPYDPRSCWFIDQMQKGDEIYLKYFDSSLRYEVVGVNVFEGDDPLIYSINTTEDYIKLVTCTPLYSNTNRIVVLARRVD